MCRFWSKMTHWPINTYPETTLIKHHGYHHHVLATQALRAVSELAENNDNRALLGKIGACELVADMIKTHGSKYPVVSEIAFRAVMNLSYDHVANRTSLGKAGVCEELVSFLRSRYHDREIAGCCATAMMNLSNNCVANKMKFGDVGACELIVTLFRKYSKLKALVQPLCGCVKNLSAHCEPNRLKFMARPDLKDLLEFIITGPMVDRQLRSWAKDALNAIIKQK